MADKTKETKASASGTTATTLTFALEKETKNAIRYQEQSDMPMVGSLYVQKWALKQLNGGGEGFPKTITLLVQVG